jgi:hypothetical protein
VVQDSVEMVNRDYKRVYHGERRGVKEVKGSVYGCNRCKNKIENETYVQSSRKTITKCLCRYPNR